LKALYHIILVPLRCGSHSTTVLLALYIVSPRTLFVMACKTRKDLWLIGTTMSSIDGSVLPTVSSVLKNFTHFHHVLHETLARSASLTYDEIMIVWGRSAIPTMEKRSVLRNFCLRVKYVNLRKHLARSTSHAQETAEINFEIEMSGLFDIAHQDAERMINDEDRTFLRLQRECGGGKMGP
jgi:hypothetical protein